MPQEKKQIILNCEELETRSALLINGHLEDYQIERKGDDIVAGSIYLGKITRIEPGLEACFVDIGAEKNAFMHFRDMLPASYYILDNLKKIGDEREKAKEADTSPKKKKRIISILSEMMLQGGTRVSKDLPPYVIAGGEPASYFGLNLVGLRRRGFSNETINAIHDVYRIIYQGGMNTSQALDTVMETLPQSPERDYIVEFIKSSPRGIIPSCTNRK